MPSWRILKERILREARQQTSTGVIALDASIAALPVDTAVVATDSFPFLDSSGVAYRGAASLIRTYVLGISGGVATIPENVSLGGTLAVTSTASFGGNIESTAATQRFRSNVKFGFFTLANAAQRVDVGSLWVSSSYSGTPPTNGIYSLGNIQTDGTLTVASTINGRTFRAADNFGGIALGDSANLSGYSPTSPDYGAAIAIGEDVFGGPPAAGGEGGLVGIGDTVLNAATGSLQRIVAIGADIMPQQTSAIVDAVLIGASIAGAANGNGRLNDSVVIGVDLLTALTGVVAGSGSVIIGNASATGFTSGATGCVIIGAATATGNTSGSNLIIIGSGAASSGTTVSNEITLGNTSITGFRVPGVDLVVSTASGFVFNDAGLAALDFRIEGDTLTHALFLDAGQDSLGLFTSSVPNFQSGRGIAYIANATTVPTGDPSGGGFLYAEGGALKWRGSSGTITTIALA